MERGRSSTVGTSQAAREIQEIAGGLVYCKDDSSIRNGFEIVTHPGTLDFWLKENGKEIMDSILQRLRSMDYHSELGGRCGYHIHTNKAAIAPLHRYNLVRFVYSQQVRMFLFGLSRRSEGQLSSYSQLTLPEESDGYEATVDRTAKNIGKGINNTGRSTVINFSSTHTAELRLLRGTLDPVKFWAGLQFYNSLLEYTNPKNQWLGLQEAPAWSSYRQYIESYPQPVEVAELRTHLREMGI